MEKKYIGAFALAALMLVSSVYALANVSAPNASATEQPAGPAAEVTAATCGVASCAASGCTQCAATTGGTCGCGCGR